MENIDHQTADQYRQTEGSLCVCVADVLRADLLELFQFEQSVEHVKASLTGAIRVLVGAKKSLQENKLQQEDSSKPSSMTHET